MNSKEPYQNAEERGRNARNLDKGGNDPDQDLAEQDENLQKIETITYDESSGWFVVSIADAQLKVRYEYYIEHDLHVGNAITQAQFQQMQEEDQRNVAAQIALRYASYCARTEKEVYDRLRREHIPADIIDDATVRLKKLGFLDDHSYALRYTEEKARLKQWGPRHLREKLREKGIAKDWIDEAISTLSDEEIQSHLQTFFDKKYKKLDLLDRKMEARALRGCVNKGYDFDAVRRVISAQKARQKEERDLHEDEIER